MEQSMLLGSRVYCHRGEYVAQEESVSRSVHLANTCLNYHLCLTNLFNKLPYLGQLCHLHTEPINQITCQPVGRWIVCSLSTISHQQNSSRPLVPMNSPPCVYPLPHVAIVPIRSCSLIRGPPLSLPAIHLGALTATE